MSRGFFNFQKNFHRFGRVLQFAFSVRLRSVQFCEKSHGKTKTSQPALRKQTKNKRNGNPSLFENIKFLQKNTEASFASFLNQNKNRDEKSSLFSFYKVHSSQINKASFAFSLNQNKNRDEKSSLLSFYKVRSSQINKASFAFFSSRRKEGQFCF